MKKKMNKLTKIKHFLHMKDIRTQLYIYEVGRFTIQFLFQILSFFTDTQTLMKEIHDVQIS